MIRSNLCGRLHAYSAGWSPLGLGADSWKLGRDETGGIAIQLEVAKISCLEFLWINTMRLCKKCEVL